MKSESPNKKLRLVRESLVVIKSGVRAGASGQPMPFGASGARSGNKSVGTTGASKNTV